jgi:hypothetical protein
VKKLVACAAGSLAALSMALVTAGHARSDGPADVSGETYAKAVALLRQQGYTAVFGGSVGGDVPQSQCVVQSQKSLSKASISLMLNCTKAAQPAPDAQAPGAPKVGSNGVTTVQVTTVQATPVPPPPPPGG